MKLSRLAVLLVFGVLVAPAARADPIRLAPGNNNHLSVSSANFMVFSFAYDTTRLVGFGFLPPPILPHCPFCAVGSSVDLDNHFSSTLDGGAVIEGLAVIGGTAYYNVRYSFDFIFDVSGNAIVRTDALGKLQNAPGFAFTGVVSAVSNGMTLLPPVALTGTGTTVLAPNAIVGDPTNRPVRLLYTFGPSPLPTPEPGTLMLVLSAAALAFRRVRLPLMHS